MLKSITFEIIVIGAAIVFGVVKFRHLLSLFIIIARTFWYYQIVIFGVFIARATTVFKIFVAKTFW
ncbi:27414_t:CDS:2, partial [Racocetra persica]